MCTVERQVFLASLRFDVFVVFWWCPLFVLNFSMMEAGELLIWLFSCCLSFCSTATVDLVSTLCAHYGSEFVVLSHSNVNLEKFEGVVMAMMQRQ